MASIATVPVAAHRPTCRAMAITTAARPPLVQRVPPHAYFVGSAIFHYLGPAFAVLLFVRVGPLGTAWLRIAAAALVLCAWRRPWRAEAGGGARAPSWGELVERRVGALGGGGRARSWGLLAEHRLLALGSVLAVMNCCFYLAIDRLALGTVAAIEFLPVIGLAALGARTRRNVAALGLAVAGVYVLTGVKLAGEPLGFAFAFANAGLFALYIVLGHRVAEDTGIDGLAASMLAALVVVTPLAGWNAVPALDDAVAVAAGVGVGVASSVIPYVCDQLAMARLPRATYALLVSLLPATATVIGIVVLGQVPSPAEVLGVALVVGGVAVHREPG